MNPHTTCLYMNTHNLLTLARLVSSSIISFDFCVGSSAPSMLSKRSIRALYAARICKAH